MVVCEIKQEINNPHSSEQKKKEKLSILTGNIPVSHTLVTTADIDGHFIACSCHLSENDVVI